MYARVSAKKKKLFTERDYDNLLKMQVNEISRKMEEGDYKEEINELGAEFDGADLIERSLNLNLANTYERLIKVSSEEAEPVIRVYLRRFDILNLKRILRWKQSDRKDEIRHILYPIGTMGISFEDIETLSTDEIIDKLNFERSMVNYKEEVESCESLEEIEDALDRLYYKELREVAERSGSKHFEKFVKEEQLNQDIKVALRMKKYSESGLNAELLTDSSKLVEIIRSQSFEEAFKEAKNLTEVDGETLEEFEHNLRVDRLERALQTLHREPLGLSSVIGYIVAKETEVENLRIVARAKETGIQNSETIKKNLVIS